jgi:hypothetical protein
MEIAGNDDNFCIPIAEHAIVIFLVDCHSGEECHIGQGDIDSHQFLHQVNELYL